MHHAHTRSALLTLCIGLFTLPGCARTAGADDTANKPIADTTVEQIEAGDGWPDPADKVVLTAEQWRERLTEMQFYVLREAGTERPFINNPFHDFKGDGVYACAGCGNALYDSRAKFDSRTGWPSYYEAVAPANVTERIEPDGSGRIGLLCARCGGHLGHVFEDGFGTPTGRRHCINSVALVFHPRKSEPAQNADETR